MPKVGDTICVNEEENLWGMWNGYFWKRIDWTADNKSWIIPKDVLAEMLRSKDREGDLRIKNLVEDQQEIRW